MQPAASQVNQYADKAQKNENNNVFSKVVHEHDHPVSSLSYMCSQAYHVRY